MPKGIGRPLNRGEKLMNNANPGSGSRANMIDQGNRENGLNDANPGLAQSVKKRSQAASDSYPADASFFKHTTKDCM